MALIWMDWGKNFLCLNCLIVENCRWILQQSVFIFLILHSVLTVSHHNKKVLGSGPALV